MVTWIMPIFRAGDDLDTFSGDRAARQNPIDARARLRPMEIMERAYIFVFSRFAGEPGVGEKSVRGEDFVSFVRSCRGIEISDQQHWFCGFKRRNAFAD